MTRLYVYLAAIATVVVALNPWLLTRVERIHGAMLVELAIAGLILAIESARAWILAENEPVLPSEPPTTPARPWRTWLVFAVIFCLWLILFRDRWLNPYILYDDKDYLRASATWEMTRSNLWMPYNDHLVIPTRVISFLCVQISNESTRPLVCSLVVIPLYLITLILLFFFARREWKSDAAGLLAVGFYALTTCQREIIQWYSASLWLTATIALLMSLLLVGDFGAPLRPWRFLAASGLCFLAPFSYSMGLLVGPLTSVWVLLKRNLHGVTRRLLASALPTISTLLAVSLIVPILLQFSGANHYVVGGSRAFGETIDYLNGIYYSMQFAVDLLFLRNLGIFRTMNVTTEPTWYYVALFPIPVVAFVLLLRLRPKAVRLLPFGLFVLASYALTIPFRTWVNYGDLVYWSRYQMVPQMGIALLMTGALCHLFPKATGMGRWSLRPGQTVGLIALASLLFTLHAGKARSPSRDMTPEKRRTSSSLEVAERSMIGRAFRSQFDEADNL
ncbi:MAG: hypothetical protein U1D30_10420 [Planctomycetota bacterium]